MSYMIPQMKGKRRVKNKMQEEIVMKNWYRKKIIILKSYI